ncbi:hypothetical protein K435DRAFT_844661 [Dendrothele bispora CBS 962.96]|uniref:Uncharacterized protein n=1 Tax=Dendrothele bispora (strain CBS 962.96) TaxID=1314807 RepID=A0A4S8L0D6_DENBC|nr:hypothetical protein K435DRAFT_844661 [Dendrothele bispora CBS 962.96]
MATDFWVSSRYKRWKVDRATLAAREEDLAFAGSQEPLDFVYIYFANRMSFILPILVSSKSHLEIGQKNSISASRSSQLQQVFFRRVHLKNSYCETDHIFSLLQTSIQREKVFFLPTTPNETEFHLVDILEYNLTVFHPYRTLLALCKKKYILMMMKAEAGELQFGIGWDFFDEWDGANGEGRLELRENALRMAWLSSLYRRTWYSLLISNLMLALHLAGRPVKYARNQIPTQSSQNSPPTSTSRSPISTISRELISLSTLWDRYHEEGVVTSTAGTNNNANAYGGPELLLSRASVPDLGTGDGATNKRSAATALLDVTPDTTHTRDDLFGDGGSTLSGSSRSTSAVAEEVEVETVHPMDSLTGSGSGAGSKRSSSGFPRGTSRWGSKTSGRWVGKEDCYAGVFVNLSRVLLRMREARLLGGGGSGENTGPTVNRMVENVKDC